MTAILVLSYLAVLALVGVALARAWRQALRASAPLPLYGMLRNQGLSPGEADDAAGFEALAYAARRCAFCAAGGDCRQRVAAGTPPPEHCPNGAMFERLTRPGF
jgi:uncharacterized protein DUF6455